MTPAARVSAAIEALADIIARRRPAADALKDWGLAHRFAGSGDRAAIASLTYDALRRRASSAHLMGDDSPRAIVLGMLAGERAMSAEAIARLCDAGRFAPAPLSEHEQAALANPSLSDAPAHVAGDYPEWLDPHLARVFGEARAQEGAALAARAALDMRVNTLKVAFEEAQAGLADVGAAPTPWSPLGLRIPLAADAKGPALKSEPAFLRGWVEIQDEGSQLAALLAAAQPGEQVVDLCAGAGGKTLALAAAMDNRGQLFAADGDKRRLAPIYERLERAGVRNTQVRTPRPGQDTQVGALADVTGTIDLVLVDAPCSGSGAWRRNPDAKWRMRPNALAQRIREQSEVLERAAALVRPGGRIAYVTCSLLEEENGAQVRAFVGRHPHFAVVPPASIVRTLGERGAALLQSALVNDAGLLLTPRRTGTDGFFIAVLTRRD